MGEESRQRIDKWLFFARVVKSRTLASKLVQGGHVRVNSTKINQPSLQIKVGDILTIALERQVLIYKVLASGLRRGPAPEARLLYEDFSPATPPKEFLPAAVQREAGAGRPTKKDRRALDKWTNQS